MNTGPPAEVILRVLAGEPEQPPRVRRIPRRDRPFPYLARWEVITETGTAARGTRRAASRRVAADYDRRLRDYHPARPRGPWYAAVPWLVHTDCDKRHRCPVCGHSGGFQAQMAQAGGYIRSWRIYTCTICGQRAADRFYLREHPCDRCRMFSHLRFAVTFKLRQAAYWKLGGRRVIRWCRRRGWYR